MARLIDADALMFRLEKRNNIATDLAFAEGLSAAMVEVEDSPTLSPDEVRGVGHWVTEQEAIDAGDYSLRDTCSVCGRCDWDCTESESFKYCPNCGAKMEVSEDA